MIIDLRSDTVTKPSEEMKKAMMMAELGDDVYGEDPTVNELQEYTADLLGKEAALFVPSGTMSNQIGIKINTNDGDEIIAESESHIYYYETAAPSLISRVQFRLIESERGEMNPEKVRAAIRPDVYYFPRTSMLCVENTHNRHGGSVISLENIKQLKRIAIENNLAFHLDGARLWNASAATGISEADYVKDFDTVSVCLSKGLGAPVGSVLVGTKEKINRALKWRKILGGGMRQAGMLAAAGLFALKENRKLLTQDHINAKAFANVIAQCEHLHIDIDRVKQTW
jgi:threonine aldolase